MKSEISIRQTSILCCFVFVGLKLVSLPSILYRLNNTGGIITAMFFFIAEIVFLILALRCKQKFPDLSLYELVQKHLGKIIAKTVYLLLLFFFLFKIILLLNENLQFLLNLLDEEMTMYLILIALLPLYNALAYNGLRSIGRTAEIFFKFIVVGFIICLLLSEVRFETSKLGPVFTEGFSGFVSSVFNSSFWFSDFIFIFVILDKVKLEPNMIKKIMPRLLLFMTVLGLLLFSYFRLFHETSFLYRNAIADVTQFRRKIGNVGNVDIFSILVYTLTTIFQGAIYFYCLKLCYEKLFGYAHKFHSLIIADILILLSQFLIFKNLGIIAKFSIEVLSYYSILIYGFVVIYVGALLLFSKKKGGQHGNYKKIYSKN